MAIILGISVLLNIILIVGVWVVWRHRSEDAFSYDQYVKRHIEDIAKAQKIHEDLQSEYLSFGKAVAESIKEIWKDIDNNYEHVHYDHILKRFGWELQIQPGPIYLSEPMISAVKEAGGEEFISENKMLFSSMLTFAWRLHIQARQNAYHIYEVVRESCGETNRSMWLAETLAMYERICGSKVEAIQELTQVLKNWNYASSREAIFATTIQPNG